MSECPIVETANGKVKGRICSRAKPEEAKLVYNYSGIPFAKPPVGDLRFEPPQKCDSWEGILEATKMAPGPMQDLQWGENISNYFVFSNEFNDDLTNIDEDCLYLNNFTSNPSKDANMPVLVWLYGGAFQLGTMAGYNAQVLCGLHDVVVVIPNYRVNIFGFFTTGRDTNHPGNMGMFDQVLALEWTRDNIRAFGGNPDNVTIFGESAGSISVGLHMLSPMSRGLFHKAIQHSGTVEFPMLIRESYSDVLKRYVEELEIEETETEAIVKKLKSLPAKFILEEAKELTYSNINFAVSVDGRFLEKMPSQLMTKKGASAPVPFIVGCNNTEGSGLLNLGQPPEFEEGFSEEDWTRLIKPALPHILMGRDVPANAFEEIKKVYGKEYDDDDQFKWSKMTANLIADSYFVVPTISQALMHARPGNPTYKYYMTQRLRCHHEKDFAEEVKLKAPFCECDHADDVTFTFGLPLMSGKMTKKARYSKDEEEMSKEWMTYLTNFAKTGNPNEGKPVSFPWPQFDEKSQRYLSAQMPFSEGNHLIPNRYKLWTKKIPLL